MTLSDDRIYRYVEDDDALPVAALDHVPAEARVLQQAAASPGVKAAQVGPRQCPLEGDGSRCCLRVGVDG